MAHSNTKISLGTSRLAVMECRLLITDMYQERGGIVVPEIIGIDNSFIKHPYALVVWIFKG